jgi:hypothetical protein
MGRIIRILVVAVIGFFALIAGLIGACVLLIAGLFGLVKRPKIQVRSFGGGFPGPGATGPSAGTTSGVGGASRTRGPAGGGDVIDVEATRVETKRTLE